VLSEGLPIDGHKLSGHERAQCAYAATGLRSPTMDPVNLIGLGFCDQEIAIMATAMPFQRRAQVPHQHQSEQQEQPAQAQTQNLRRLGKQALAHDEKSEGKQTRASAPPQIT
jgi:hypothetical protein